MRSIRHAFERQRRFIADARHKLHTPVAVVRARAEVLERQWPMFPPAARHEVQQLLRDAEELSGLLDALLDLARLDGHQVELALEPVALGEVAEEIVGRLQPLAQSRAVHLETPAGFVWGRANLARVRQALRALADNALKYTPAGGRVVVGVARRGDWACITVADTGQGIAPEQLLRVVEPFYHDESVPPARVGRRGPGPHDRRPARALDARPAAPGQSVGQRDHGHRPAPARSLGTLTALHGVD
jgi:signal transduction histidine kinase